MTRLPNFRSRAYLIVFASVCITACGKQDRERAAQTGAPTATSHLQETHSDGQKPRDIDYPDGGVELGQGWQSTTGQKTNAKCLEYAAAKDSAQDKSLDLKEVVDKSSLMQQLEVSAEAQVKGIAGSASAKVKFVTSTKVDEEQSNFSVHAKVLNGAIFVGPPPKTGQIDLTPTYAKLARSNLKQFFAQCGDSYVSALMGGAELSAVLLFHIYQIDEKKSLSASVSGSGFGTFDASGSVNQTMNKYSSSSQFTILYHEVGGSGDPIPTNQAGLVEVIHKLPSLAQTDPQYFRVKLNRYDSLPSWPNKQSDWLYTQYEAIASQYGKFDSLHDSVVTMLAHPDDYVLGYGVTVGNLQTIEGNLLKHLQSLKKKSISCMQSSGSDCEIDATDKISDYEYRIQLPVRKDACTSYTAWQAAIVDAPAKHKAWVDAVNYWKAIAENLRVNEKQKFWSAQTVNQYNADQQAAALLQKLTQDFPEGLRSSISLQWIELPARARCASDVLSSGCIDEASIQKLKQRIVIDVKPS